MRSAFAVYAFKNPLFKIFIFLACMLVKRLVVED